MTLLTVLHSERPKLQRVLAILSVIRLTTRLICFYSHRGLGFHEDLITPVTQAEAVYIKNLVQSSLKSLLPGATMEVTGGFRRYPIYWVVRHFPQRQP